MGPIELELRRIEATRTSNGMRAWRLWLYPLDGPDQGAVQLTVPSWAARDWNALARACREALGPFYTVPRPCPPGRLRLDPEVPKTLLPPAWTDADPAADEVADPMGDTAAQADFSADTLPPARRRALLELTAAGRGLLAQEDAQERRGR